MPYSAIYKVRGRWAFKNLQTGRVRKFSTRQKAVNELRFLYAFEGRKHRRLVR